MKTKNSLKLFLVAFMAIFAGSLLSGCSSDDNNEPKVQSVELVATTTVSEDLASVMSIQLITNVTDNKHISKHTNVLKTCESAKYTETSTSLPAQISAEVAAAVKNLNKIGTLKESYNINFEITYTLVAHLSDGTSYPVQLPTNIAYQITTSIKPSMSANGQEIDINNLKDQLNDIKDRINEACTLSLKSVQASGSTVTAK